MLQENSFFSSPFVFYGENNNDEQIEDVEEIFSELWSISLDTSKSIFPPPRIGLFLHWGDIDE